MNPLKVLQREDLPQFILDLEQDGRYEFPVECFQFRRGHILMHSKTTDHPFFISITPHQFWNVIVWVLDECRRRYPDGAGYRDHWNRIRRSVTPKVYARDGHICSHCGATSGLSVDHIVPLAAGGSNDMDNLQILCRSCNSRKGVRVR